MRNWDISAADRAKAHSRHGANYKLGSIKRTVDAFRTKVLRELKKIKLACPKLTYTTAPGS